MARMRTPKAYMLMFNVGKAQNFGTLLRSAAAFNICEVFVVSSSGTKLRNKSMRSFGSQGTAKKMDMRVFESIRDVRDYCVAKRITICGIEITPESTPIQDHVFRGDTLFLVGNEGSGLNDNQRAMCDAFVRVPQYTDKTASLNVAVAASIVLHHFAMQAGYQEAGKSAQKYDVGQYRAGKDTKRVLMASEKEI